MFAAPNKKGLTILKIYVIIYIEIKKGGALMRDITALVNVFDEYEGDELLAAGVSMREAANIWAEREADTDGECDVHCYSFYNHKEVTHLVAVITPDFEG